MRRGRVWGAGAVGAAGVALALVAGCTSGGGGGGPEPTGTTSGAARSFLTGEPGAAGHVLAVKIDNVPAARPQTGLNDADIVYAIEVEGGLSRLMAVYDSEHLPSAVGPVRSARQTDVQLLAEYDKPALAFSGAQSELLPELKKSDTLVAVTGTKDFFRNHDRPAPHNEYLHPEAAAAKGGIAKDIGLRFATTVPAGGTAVNTASAKMPAARFSFAWNGSEYRVSMDGKQSPWKADNVIIQHVAVKQSDFHSRTGFVPFSQTVGHGSAQILRNGRSYAATWDRPSETDGTAYTVDGRTLPLQPGHTWIVLEP